MGNTSGNNERADKFMLIVVQVLPWFPYLLEHSGISSYAAYLYLLNIACYT